MPVVLYGCDHCSDLAKSSDCGLPIILVRDIFGHKRAVLVEDWRNLNSEELCGMFFSLNIIRVMRPKIRWVVWLSRRKR